jgi:hypothetical protein
MELETLLFLSSPHLVPPKPKGKKKAVVRSTRCQNGLIDLGSCTDERAQHDLDSEEEEKKKKKHSTPNNPVYPSTHSSQTKKGKKRRE